MAGCGIGDKVVANAMAACGRWRAQVPPLRMGFGTMAQALANAMTRSNDGGKAASRIAITADAVIVKASLPETSPKAKLPARTGDMGFVRKRHRAIVFIQPLLKMEMIRHYAGRRRSDRSARHRATIVSCASAAKAGWEKGLTSRRLHGQNHMPSYGVGFVGFPGKFPDRLPSGSVAIAISMKRPFLALIAQTCHCICQPLAIVPKPSSVLAGPVPASGRRPPLRLLRPCLQFHS